MQSPDIDRCIKHFPTWAIRSGLLPFIRSNHIFDILVWFQAILVTVFFFLRHLDIWLIMRQRKRERKRKRQGQVKGQGWTTSIPDGWCKWWWSRCQEAKVEKRGFFLMGNSEVFVALENWKLDGNVFYSGGDFVTTLKLCFLVEWKSWRNQQSWNSHQIHKVKHKMSIQNSQVGLL